MNPVMGTRRRAAERMASSAAPGDSRGEGCWLLWYWRRRAIRRPRALVLEEFSDEYVAVVVVVQLHVHRRVSRRNKLETAALVELNAIFGIFNCLLRFSK